MGAEHPRTLASRMSLAAALEWQGMHAEAEQELRTVLQIQQRVLGSEHPDVAMTSYHLAFCLKAQRKLPEALEFVQHAEQVWTKVLGPFHPDTISARTEHAQIAGMLK